MNIDDETSPHDVITSDVLVKVDNDGSIENFSESTTNAVSVTTTTVASNDHEYDQDPIDNGTSAATANAIDTGRSYPFTASHTIVTAAPVSISLSITSVPITCSTQTITNRTTTTASTRSINDIFINKMPFLKKPYRKTYERSNSAGKIYQTGRRVSFPENDSDLVTGYLEPANPWASGKFKKKKLLELHFPDSPAALIA